MFKKQLLAASVLALATGAAFADNEGAILQSGADTANNTATIEQIYATNSVSAQIIQNGDGTGDHDTAAVYQGAVSATGAGFDTSTGTIDSQSNYGQNNPSGAVQFDLNDASVSDTDLGSLLANQSANDVALIKQDTTLAATSFAKVIQVTGAETTTVDFASTLMGSDAALQNGNALLDQTDGFSMTVGAVTVTDKSFNANTNNTDNIAVVSQGVVGSAVTRDGTALTDATGEAAQDALIVQAGTQLTAVVLQQGAASAAVFQAGTGNDAYVVQYGDGVTNEAYVMQVATNDVATVYQTGSSQKAGIYQH